MIKISAADTAAEYAHEVGNRVSQARNKATQEVKGAVANDLIQIIAVVGFIALFGSGIILGLSAMKDAVSNNTEAKNFITKSIDSFGIVPGLLKVIVVFGFVSVLIGLLWFAMGRMGLGQKMRGGL